MNTPSEARRFDVTKVVSWVLIAYVATFVVWSRVAEGKLQSHGPMNGYLFVAGVLLSDNQPASWRLEFIVQTVFMPLIKIDELLGGPGLEATSVPMFDLSSSDPRDR